MRNWVYRRPFFRADKPKIPLERPEQAVKLTIVKRRRLFLRAPQRIGPKSKIPLPRTPDGKQGPIKRFMRAVMRMREAMRRRLAFRPFEFPPTAPATPIHAPPRGEIGMAGAVEGAIFSAGAKRGQIDG